MSRGDRREPGVRAVIFDLDEALIDSSAAWAYTVEQALAMAGHPELDARPLAAEYRRRPWRDALRVLLNDPFELKRCEELCERLYARSSMKRLLVHEGVGMALDQLRGRRVPMAGATRLPHVLAMRQIESTGLDRFFTVLSPTPAGEHWDAAARIEECRGYLETEPGACVFVGIERWDLEAAAGAGVHGIEAGWAANEATGFPALAVPGELVRLVEAR